MDGECIALLLEHDTWYVPTLAVSHLTASQATAIHFYTQRIERLDAQLWAIILAGLAIAAAAGLWDYNAGRTVTASPNLAP
jgi:hypothetical protein